MQELVEGLLQLQVPGGAQSPQRARLRGYALWLSRDKNRVDYTTAAYNRMESKHSVACKPLNRDIDADEVNAALLKLKDVGAGPDNLPPISLYSSRLNFTKKKQNRWHRTNRAS